MYVKTPMVVPRDEGARADGEWFAGKTEADLRRERAQILATDARALLQGCAALEHMAKTGAVCVVAHEDALKACDTESLVIAE